MTSESERYGVTHGFDQEGDIEASRTRISIHLLITVNDWKPGIARQAIIPTAVGSLCGEGNPHNLRL